MNDHEQQVREELQKKLDEAEATIIYLQEQKRSLAEANAGSAELLAELELKSEQVSTLNQTLARANAGAAELMAELELNQAEMERLNELLLSEKERLSIILRSIGDGIIVTGTGGMVEMLNSEAEALTGWAQWEVAGKNLDELLKFQSKEGTSLTGSLVTLIEENKDTCLGETWLLTRSGQRTPVEVSIAMIRDPGNVVTGAVYVFRDRTEQQKAERLKEEFLSTMTHDLKSPLNSLSGFIELLAQPAYGEISQAKLEFVDWMKYSATILLDLINNIVENSRIRAGQMNYHFENFSLTALIDELRGTFGPQSITGSIILDFSCQREVFVYADRQRIRQVFHNLVSNAMRFTPKGGTISIHAVHQNGRIEVEVADTGKGIPLTEQGKLFTRFCNIKGDRRGTGLGLFNVKTFLNAHGSTITCESSPGKGTKFFFYLAEGKGVQKSAPVKSRLLLVGEDIDVIQLLNLALEDDGHTVDFTISGAEALQMISTFKPDVVVIVEPLIDMPVEAFHYTLVNELKERIPIMLLSHQRRHEWEDLCDEMIPLPFEKQVFRNALAKVLALPFSS